MCIAQDFRKLEMRENWLKEGQKDYAISTSFFHEENIDTRIRDICGSIFFRYYSYQLHNLKTKSSNILTKLRLHGIGRRNKVLKHGFSQAPNIKPRCELGHGFFRHTTIYLSTIKNYSMVNTCLLLAPRYNDAKSKTSTYWPTKFTCLFLYSKANE